MMDPPNPEKIKEILESEDLDKKSVFSYRSEEHKKYKGLITWSVKKSDLNVCRCGNSEERAFSIGRPDFCKLKLRVFPFGTAENSKNFVSFTISFRENLPHNSWYSCTLALISKMGETLKSDEQTGRGENINEVSFSCFTQTKTLPEFYVDNKLIIQCTIKIYGNSYNCKSDDAEFAVHDSHVVKEFTKKLFEKLPTDVEFENKEGDTIRTNKAVLMCEVPVLRILFKGAPLDETKFKLPFISTSLLKEIIQFICTENIQFSSFQHACEIYHAACCLKINTLKDICSGYIGGNLSEKNLFVVQVIAQKWCDEKLLIACFEFIKNCDSKLLAHSSMLSLDKVGL